MLAGLKSALRRWLLDVPEATDPSPWIDAVVARGRGRHVVRLRVTGVVGLRLVCVPEREADASLLVGEEQALDREHFWRLWAHHGRGQGFRWEDGTPFSPRG